MIFKIWVGQTLTWILIAHSLAETQSFILTQQEDPQTQKSLQLAALAKKQNHNKEIKES